MSGIPGIPGATVLIGFKTNQFAGFKFPGPFQSDLSTLQNLPFPSVLKKLTTFTNPLVDSLGYCASHLAPSPSFKACH